MDTSTLPGAAPAADTAAGGERCQMCEHPVAEHDALSRRYCQATATGALSRGCICR